MLASSIKIAPIKIIDVFDKICFTKCNGEEATNSLPALRNETNWGVPNAKAHHTIHRSELG